MKFELHYFVLIGIVVWNIVMLSWNIVNTMPLLLLGIMCALPSVLFFGIFVELDNQKGSQYTASESKK